MVCLGKSAYKTAYIFLGFESDPNSYFEVRLCLNFTAKIKSMRFLLTALVCLISVSSSKPMLGQGVTVQIEQVENRGIVPGNTYRVYAVLPTAQHSVHAVFGSYGHVLSISTTGSFFQHQYGSNSSLDINQSIVDLEPRLAFDSWVTIGVDNSDQNELWQIDIDWTQFLAGGSITATDGAWFVAPDDENAFPKKENKVLLMQLTTTGTITGVINLQGRNSYGETWRVHDLTFTSSNLSGSNTRNQTKTSPTRANDISGRSERENDNIRIRISSDIVDISKVAVIGKESTLCDGTVDNGAELAELVEGELLGVYGVVERRHLEEILDEQRLAMSGLIFEDTDFARAGCLAGAQGTVLTSYGCLQGKTKLQVKLVDCSTSDLYWSATGFDVSEFDLMDALRTELGN